jgi:hypothetical protein
LVLFPTSGRPPLLGSVGNPTRWPWCVLDRIDVFADFSFPFGIVQSIKFVSGVLRWAKSLDAVR